MTGMFKKIDKLPKNILDDLLKNKSVITGKKVTQNSKELEIPKKQLKESIEFEEENRRIKISNQSFKTQCLLLQL